MKEMQTQGKLLMVPTSQQCYDLAPVLDVVCDPMEPLLYVVRINNTEPISVTLTNAADEIIHRAYLSQGVDQHCIAALVSERCGVYWLSLTCGKDHLQYCLVKETTETLAQF